jgi:hypothetical protein
MAFKQECQRPDIGCCIWKDLESRKDTSFDHMTKKLSR